MSRKGTKRLRRLIQGNEAVVEGALAAGCNFFAGYPITPASEIAELFAEKMPKVGGMFIQMEDEISSLGAVLGASLAGAKAMTATSGPGFSLMQENLGFGCIAEIPCVIVNVMRAGPSTGLPTSPSQGDVLQARWGTHGDHPIIVLAVSSAYDCFTLTVEAFNLSERFRVPVILLSDAIVAHTRETVEFPDPQELHIINRPRPTMPPEWYIPYQDTSSGVPPMAAFGDGYRYHVTGLIHDVRGFPTQREDEIRAFMSRLFRKITQGFQEIFRTEDFMLEDSEYAIIAYGSVARSAKMATILARKKGIKVGVLQLISLFPFPKKRVQEVLSKSIGVLVPEMNLGQISREVKRVNDCMTKVFKLNRIDGQGITPHEILGAIEHMVEG